MTTLSRLFLAAACGIFCAELHAGNLKVTLTPSQAVTAGAEWRVDGGAWRGSGTTVKNLSNTTHQVDFKSVSGWLSPAPVTVTITNGNTTTLTSTYVQPASCKITLTPNTGQWRIDGGAWRSSGTTATGLAPGNHTVDYSSLSGYTSPPTETVALTAAQTTTLVRSYTPLARLTVTLAPTSAQWRVDGGVWQPSGTTVANLAPGSHAVDYSALAGYIAPAGESVTLASGQTLSLNRSYVQLAQLSVSLTPSSGQWRIDGGAWQSSGAVATNLTPGSHTVSYSSLANYASPVAEAVSLASGQSLSLSRNYTQLAQISIGLVPASGQWRANGGAWQPTGSSLFVLPGNYLIEYSSLADYDPPANETITLAAGGVFAATRNYTTQKPSLRIDLTPASGQWRVDGGAWRASGAQIAGLNIGAHTVEYTDIGGIYAPLPSESISLGLRENAVLTRTYPPKPPASFNVSLTPAYAQWRLDGGAWQYTPTTLNNLSLGTHTVDFSPVEGYITPPSETVTLVSGANPTLVRSYAVNFAQVTVTLDPTQAQWRIYPSGSTPGGVWNNSGATVSSLVPGSYTVEYAPVAGYETPPPETIALASGENKSISRAYTVTTLSFVYRFNDTGNFPTAILGRDGFLYCAASTGASSGLGHIFRLNQDGTGYLELKRFGSDPADGTEPTTLLQGSDGVLYGCTKYSAGGTSTNNGTIYRINQDGTGYAVLHVFDIVSQGSNPNSLIEGSDGMLYGTTNAGGYSSSGVVFRINKDGTGFTMLSSLYNIDGTNPQAIVEGPDGALYGTARSGGVNNNGLVFKLNKDGSGLVVLKSFAGGTDGSSPRAGLLAGSDGLLYGTLAVGGTSNCGLVFSLNPAGTGYTVLHHFLGGPIDGRGSETALSEDASGVLYGATLSGGTSQRGTLFKLNKDGSGYALLANLSGGTVDGGFPRQRLVVSGAGTVFGSDTLGGLGGNGTLFRLGADGSAFTVIRPMGAPDGAYPDSNVIEASDGALYGTTSIGGIKKVGTVYRVNQDGTGYTVLHRFNDSSDGALPFNHVTEASDGLIYGTTYGSQPTYSTLYRMNKDGSGYSVIHHFDSTANGTGAWGGVLESSDGTLYGTCTGGGTNGLGAVYRISKDGSGFAFIHSFAGGANDGSTPNAELVEATDGRLYGTTYYGGAANLGTVFGLNKDGTGYCVLRQFTGGAADGANPASPLFPGDDGLLYGTTPAVTGGNLGTVYRLATDGTGYTVVRIFSGTTTDGSDPSIAGVIEKAGVLYGTTSKGGSFGKGVIYSLSPNGTGFQIWVNFGAGLDDGWYPAAGVVNGRNGNFFGTTFNGASGGTIFRFRPN